MNQKRAKLVRKWLRMQGIDPTDNAGTWAIVGQREMALPDGRKIQVPVLNSLVTGGRLYYVGTKKLVDRSEHAYKLIERSVTTSSK